MAAERAIAASELQPGELRCVLVGGRPICLAHADDGQFYAFDDECTHEEASLSEGWLNGGQVECPLHFATFDLRTGEATASPAVDPVRTYAVTVEGDDVLIDLTAPAVPGV